jgi:hypothetical protein
VHSSRPENAWRQTIILAKLLYFAVLCGDRAIRRLIKSEEITKQPSREFALLCGARLNPPYAIASYLLPWNILLYQ